MKQPKQVSGTQPSNPSVGLKNYAFFKVNTRSFISHMTMLPHAAEEMGMITAQYTAIPHAEGATSLQTEIFLLLQYDTLKSSTTPPNKLKPASLKV